MDPLLATVIIVALICTTVVIVALSRRPSREMVDVPSRKSGPRAQTVEPSPPAPPLQEISFKQALESDAVAGGLEQLARRQVEYALGVNTADASVEAVSLADEQDKLVIAYRCSPDGTAPAETGEAIIPLHRESGKFFPVLKQAGRGPIARFARRTSFSSASASNAAAMLTGVAHVLPGIEVLRSLKEVDRNLSELAAGRSIDQLAEIETIYNRLSEIFSREDWVERRADLIASRDQLFKLRATWRRELEQVLDSAPETPDTQAAENFAKLGSVFFPPAFFMGKSWEMRRESEEQKLFGHLASTADLLQRIRLAMLLDISVSQSLGEAETLAGVAMRNELEMWGGILEKFQSKRDGIRTYQTPRDLQTVADALQGYVHMLSSISAVSQDAGEVRRGFQSDSPQLIAPARPGRALDAPPDRSAQHNRLTAEEQRKALRE